eukprot:1756319-Lingulodinium_polyedra.AAC.1
MFFPANQRPERRGGGYIGRSKNFTKRGHHNAGQKRPVQFVEEGFVALSAAIGSPPVRPISNRPPSIVLDKAPALAIEQ